jgi:hypothetical protein
MRRSTALVTAAVAAMGLLAWGGMSAAAQDAAKKNAAPAKAPQVMGEWTGVWADYSPEAPGGLAKKYGQTECPRMDAKVEQTADGKWQATFWGECGRPYKYTITMLGRQAGNTVLFQGRADLGEKDGGVYDWIGRCTEKEFTGFFTSRGHNGLFRLARPSSAAAAPTN